MGLKDWLKARPALLRPALWLYRVGAPLLAHPLAALRHYPRFLADWRRYRLAGGEAGWRDLFPCLLDRTSTTGFDPQYVYQAAWAAQRIREDAPAAHVDVGSDLKLVAMLCALTPVTFIDIRPAELRLPGFTGRPGSITDLPFPDASVASLSCLHVIEHIGLGRYGDPIDPAGSARAFAELRRVLAPGGRLYLSTTLGRPRVQFNGQRLFSAAQVVDALPGLNLRSMAWVDGLGRYHPETTPDDPRLARDAGLDFTLGLFVFDRPECPA